jgi:hypothetical protein
VLQISPLVIDSIQTKSPNELYDTLKFCAANPMPGMPKSAAMDVSEFRSIIIKQFNEYKKGNFSLIIK